MDRDEDWQHQRGQQDAGHGLELPLSRSAAPSEAEARVKPLYPDVLRPVPDYRHVGKQRDEYEQGASYQVRSDRAWVPNERRPDVGPDPTREVVGEHPEVAPGSADVEQRRVEGCHQREDGHHFSGPRDRTAPLRLCQPENGGDHDPRVANADPEHEIDQEEAPEDGPVEAGHAETLIHHVAKRAEAGEHDKREE